MTEQAQGSESGATRTRRKRRSQKGGGDKANGAGTASAAEEVAARKAKAKEAEKAAREAEKEAEKAAKEAEKAAEKAAREAEKAAEKAAREAELEKARQSALKSLTRCAKDINSRFAAEERAEKRADDQRLAAAIVIAEAKGIARDAKIPFKPWCEENLHFPPREKGGEPRKLSYETVRKLLPIGEAEAEAEGAGMKLLEDMRASNAAANREARRRRREEQQQGGGDGGGGEPDSNKLRSRAQKAMDNMETDAFVEFMEEQAKTAGYRLVDSEADDEPKDGDNSARMTARERAEVAFEKLKGRSKLAFARWVCEQVGWQPEVLVEMEAEEEV